MKAVGFRTNLSVTDADALVDFTAPVPEPGSRDLLVSIRAVSVNPVDIKTRLGGALFDDGPRILGWDASGVVEAVGSNVTLFQPGDEVFYAGSLTRQGTNAEYHVVDERIVGRKPKSLTFAEAAALPLTSITAWELLFDRLKIPRTDEASGQSILVVGAAGGVGSILLQLVRQLTGITVIASASRPETKAWCESLGAHYVIDHTNPLHEELREIGIPEVSYVASLTATDEHFAFIAEAVRPQGKVALIDDPIGLDIRALKRKSASLHWEFMFTRSFFATADMIEQHHLLNSIATLVDGGIVHTTLTEHFGIINANNLLRAHALIESGRAKGKIVLEGF